MSDQLAVSSALSVLMMSIFVLSSTGASHAPFGPQSLAAPVSAAMPELSEITDRLLPISR
jgi:hypothetical protein